MNYIFHIINVLLLRNIVQNQMSASDSNTISVVSLFVSDDRNYDTHQI